MDIAQLSTQINQTLNTLRYGENPAELYEPIRYIMSLGGKRIRPLMVLLAAKMYDDDVENVLLPAAAVEVFHNFTLMHDDIMDQAPLRRGKPTVHQKWNSTIAILSGDVMLVKAYDYLNKVTPRYAKRIVHLFNRTAKEVCEGQQLDMDFERRVQVAFDEYLNMINVKTSVLLAASLQMGAILGGALERNQNLLYEFGRKLGLAFQVQDDYLDAFGDPEKFGKQVGGDIKSNKKTFLLIHALETADGSQLQELESHLQSAAPDKVDRVLSIFRECKVDEWAMELKDQFMKEALTHLDDIAVVSSRKEPLKRLALYLMQRQS